MGDGVHQGFSSGSAFGKGQPNRAPHFFLNINDDGGLAQFLGEALVLPTQFLHLFFLRIASGLGAALVRGQALDHAGLPLTPPRDQVGGIEAFTAQQGSDAAGVGRGSISFCQDGQFVVGSEGPTLSGGDHFRVRPRRAGRLGRYGFARPSTAGVLASLGLPTFRGRQNRRGI